MCAISKKARVTRFQNRFRVRSTNEKGYYQMFFTGPEDLINMLNESKNLSDLQREIERVSKRTDIRLKRIIWQGAWRSAVTSILRRCDLSHLLLDQICALQSHSRRDEPSSSEVSSHLAEANKMAYALQMLHTPTLRLGVKV